MQTTNAPHEWLDNLENRDIEDINNLYECVIHKSQIGAFKCSENNGCLFISNEENDQTLILASEKDVKAFLDKLDKEYGGDFGWVGGNWEFIRNMRKDD